MKLHLSWISSPRVCSGSRVVLPMGLALASAAALIAWAPAPAHAQSSARSVAPAVASGHTEPAQAPVTATPTTPDAQATEPSVMSGANADDSAWLAMLVVAGVLAGTVLHKQGR